MVRPKCWLRCAGGGRPLVQWLAKVVGVPVTAGASCTMGVLRPLQTLSGGSNHQCPDTCTRTTTSTSRSLDGRMVHRHHFPGLLCLPLGNLSLASRTTRTPLHHTHFQRLYLPRLKSLRLPSLPFVQSLPENLLSLPFFGNEVVKTNVSKKVISKLFFFCRPRESIRDTVHRNKSVIK